MNTYLLLALRLVHILAGILWSGTAVFYLFYIKPAVKLVGPTGGRFMEALVERRKYPLFMVSTSLLTVIAGGVLYWNASGGFTLAWIKTGTGVGFTIGSLSALIAFLTGNIGIGPTSAKMGVLGQQMLAAGGPPSPEQLTAMQALERKLNTAEWIDFIALVIAMLTMATARYWI